MYKKILLSTFLIVAITAHAITPIGIFAESEFPELTSDKPKNLIPAPDPVIFGVTLINPDTGFNFPWSNTLREGVTYDLAFFQGHQVNIKALQITAGYRLT